MSEQKKDQYTEIIIKWQIKKSFDKFSEIENNTRSIYQIYGDSHIYGRSVLMYIGKSERLQKRLNEHGKSFFQYANNLSYIEGRIEDRTMNLEIPESILIANHKPFMNKTFIHDLPESAKKEKIIVFNDDNHAMLKNSCTNYWWVEDYRKKMKI